MRLKLTSITVLSLAILLGSASSAFADPPPQVAAGTPANGFATQFTGCLGGLRSAIAPGDLKGVTLPRGLVLPSGFSGSVHPARPLRTVPAQTLPRRGR